MMRLVLSILLLWSGLVWAETPVETAEKTYNAAVDVAKKEFDAKVKVAKDKYVAVLKTEMEALTKKGDLDGAVKIRDQIANLEAKEKPTSSEITKDGLLSLQQVVERFQIGNLVEERGCLTGDVGNMDQNLTGFRLKTPVQASTFSFGFRIRAKWYQCIIVEINQEVYCLSRGHHQNLDTVFKTPGQPDKRLAGRVEKQTDWCEMNVIGDGTNLVFSYQGKVVVKTPVQKGPYSLRVGFNSHDTTISVKDFYLRYQ